MSQKQIQSLELLSLGAEDLRAAVYKAVEDNPALVITNDSLAQGADVAKVSKGPIDYTHLSSSTTAAAREASDNFQAALESKADERQSLTDHLLSQYHMLHLSKAELSLGEKLIHNLDCKGFHMLAPDSLLDHDDPEQTEALLNKCLSTIQHLDPIGTCVKGTEESLYVQALTKQTLFSSNKGYPLALLILDGHFAFLDPPKPAKIVKKISDFLAERSHLFGLSEKELAYQKLEVTEDTVEAALDFIKTLDPFPARDFGTSSTTYIAPDVYVRRIPEHADHDDFARGIVTDESYTWSVRLTHDSVPQVEISPEFLELATTKNTDAIKAGSALSADDKKLVSGSIKKAQEFLETLQMRDNTIARACCIIVKKQHVFFAKGPGNLVPLRQQDIADELGVHETTISRMASSKYIQCEWGLFDIKYFFTNAASRNPSSTQVVSSSSMQSTVTASKDNVLFAIQKILDAHKDDAKKLSDQKLTDILASQGVTIARRTVAKYRSQLNIESSFNR